MSKKNFSKAAVIAIVVAFLVASCGPAPTPATTGAPATQAPTEAATSVIQPSFVLIVPGPVGASQTLGLLVDGINTAGPKWNAKVQVMEASDPTSWQENVQAAVNNKATIVITFGYQFTDALTSIVPTAPDVQFVAIDTCIDPIADNIYCVASREYESAFLTGVEAALLTKTNKVGTVGALDIPLLHRLTDGFAQGAQFINPTITVETRWVGGDNPFSDPVRAKQQALAMASAGFDPIAAAAAGGNTGIFEAAKEAGFQTYGGDINQCPEAPGFVVDDQLKHVDIELRLAIDAIMEGNVTLHYLVYGLSEGGVGTIAQLSADDIAASQCIIAAHPEVIQKVKEVAQKIVSGELKLKDPAGVLTQP